MDRGETVNLAASVRLGPIPRGGIGVKNLFIWVGMQAVQSRRSVKPFQLVRGFKSHPAHLTKYVSAA